MPVRLHAVLLKYGEHFPIPSRLKTVPLSRPAMRAVRFRTEQLCMRRMRHRSGCLGNGPRVKEDRPWRNVCDPRLLSGM